MSRVIIYSFDIEFRKKSIDLLPKNNYNYNNNNNNNNNKDE